MSTAIPGPTETVMVKAHDLKVGDVVADAMGDLIVQAVSNDHGTIRTTVADPTDGRTDQWLNDGEDWVPVVRPVTPEQIAARAEAARRLAAERRNAAAGRESLFAQRDLYRF